MTRAAADFYRTRAEGGVGLIVFANMQWDKVRHAHNVPLLTDEKYIPTLETITSAIHEGGAKVFAQIMHRGTSAPARHHRRPGGRGPLRRAAQVHPL